MVTSDSGCKRIRRSTNVRLKAPKSQQSITSTMASYKDIYTGHRLNWPKFQGHEQSRGLFHSPHQHLFLANSSAWIFRSQIGSKWNSSAISWLMLLHLGVFTRLCNISSPREKNMCYETKCFFQWLVLNNHSLLRLSLLFLCSLHDTSVSKY